MKAAAFAPITPEEIDARWLYDFGFTKAVEQTIRNGKGEYVGHPKPVSVARIAAHRRGETPPLSFPAGDYYGKTSRIAVIEIDAHFPERFHVLAGIVQGLGLQNATRCCNGSDEGRGKFFFFFGREHPREALDEFVRALVKLARRDKRWIGGESKIEYRPYPGGKGLIRIAGRNVARGGPVERIFTVDAEPGCFSDVVPISHIPPLVKRRNRRPESKRVRPAALHSTVERWRNKGLDIERQGHRELRSDLGHVAREALALHFNMPDHGRAKYLGWCHEIRERTEWATSSFRSPTSGTKGNPLRDKALESIWECTLRWWMNGQAGAPSRRPGIEIETSLQPEGAQRASAADDASFAANGASSASPAAASAGRCHDVSIWRREVLEAAEFDGRPLQGRTLDGCMDLLAGFDAVVHENRISGEAFGVSTGTMSEVTGLSRSTCWRYVHQRLVPLGLLVAHDRGLDKSFVIVDDGSPTGWRCGLRMVLGIVLPESTPEQVRVIGEGRHVVKRQRGRVGAAKLRRHIEESANVTRISNRRGVRAAVRRALEPERSLPPGGGEVLPFSPPEPDLTAEQSAKLWAYVHRRIGFGIPVVDPVVPVLQPAFVGRSRLPVLGRDGGGGPTAAAVPCGDINKPALGSRARTS